MTEEARRLQGVPPSGIRRIFEMARQLEARGVDVIHLELGRPDFDTPAHIKEAAKASLDRGEVHYTSNYGTPALCQAIANKLARDNGLTYDPSGEIVTTVGAGEAIFLVLAAYLNPDDEVLVLDPGWLNYAQVPAMLGATAVPVPLAESDAYALHPDILEARITPRTRGLILNSPHNPTGVGLSRDTLEAVARMVERHGLWVISDEIYEHITYDGFRHTSFASLPGMRDRTFLVNGCSKAYSMTGWRIGYVAAPRRLIAPILKVHQYLITCATSFAQAGAAAALSGPQQCVADMTSEFARRREALLAALAEIPGVSCVRPHGAFYLFPNVRVYGLAADAMAEYLLQHAGVAVVPGSAFGAEGEGHVRVSYCTALERVVEGGRRIARALADLAAQGVPGSL
ncbi:MAG: pyridoxal phosphate-dependent aminotransferase [bacterium]|nr:pyridoxal phosphate-dependent aminotransferase [bacterium]